MSSGIVEAPVFHPSEEEWKRPIRYIQSIRPQAERAGKNSAQWLKSFAKRDL